MLTRILRPPVVALVVLATCSCPAENRMDIVEIPGASLKGNPLNDAVVRKAAVFIPAQFETNKSVALIYYLPGYGGSSEKLIQNPGPWLQTVQAIADGGFPALLVVVDGRTRWGGSQYLNSPAQGNYADYVAVEIVSFIEKHYQLKMARTNRVIAGHSSGGFGALRLGLLYPQRFGKVVALSPDSDFEVSHRPLVTLPAVSGFPPADVRRWMAPEPAATAVTNGDVRYALGLSAAYAPLGRRHPGQFRWLYDDHGRFRERVWREWMNNDPLTIVRKDRRAFANQAVYLDGPAQDEYKANIGARKMYEVLHARGVCCIFNEPPGKHSSRTRERLAEGFAWVMTHSPSR